MRRAGFLAIGAIVLLGGMLQRAPEYCPMPLRSFLAGEPRVPVPQPRPSVRSPREDVGFHAVAREWLEDDELDSAAKLRLLDRLAESGPEADPLLERATANPDPRVARRAGELLDGKRRAAIPPR